MATVLHRKDQGNVSVYKQSFLTFIVTKLGIEADVILKLFNFVEQPLHGQRDWITKSHRRNVETYCNAFQILLSKIQNRSSNGHMAYSFAIPPASMGSNGVFVRVLSDRVGRETPFFGMSKPPLGGNVG